VDLRCWSHGGAPWQPLNMATQSQLAPRSIDVRFSGCYTEGRIRSSGNTKLRRSQQAVTESAGAFDLSWAAWGSRALLVSTLRDRRAPPASADMLRAVWVSS
jgi:hypothetical protein